MNVLILGFENEYEIDAEMEKLIAESGCYLFNVLVGGIGVCDEASPSEKYAALRGAPRYYIYKDNLNDLMRELVYRTDFILIKMGDNTPQWQKNLMMRIRDKGGHGRVVR